MIFFSFYVLFYMPCFLNLLTSEKNSSTFKHFPKKITNIWMHYHHITLEYYFTYREGKSSNLLETIHFQIELKNSKLVNLFNTICISLFPVIEANMLPF